MSVAREGPSAQLIGGRNWIFIRTYWKDSGIRSIWLASGEPLPRGTLDTHGLKGTKQSLRREGGFIAEEGWDEDHSA